MWYVPFGSNKQTLSRLGASHPVEKVGRLCCTSEVITAPSYGLSLLRYRTFLTFPGFRKISETPTRVTNQYFRIDGIQEFLLRFHQPTPQISSDPFFQDFRAIFFSVWQLNFHQIFVSNQDQNKAVNNIITTSLPPWTGAPTNFDHTYATPMPCLTYEYK